MTQHYSDADLRQRAEAVIPGGMYGHQSVAFLPQAYPQFFSRGKGAYTWDADSKKYLDYMCGYGPALFGYANDAIDQAYSAQLKIGDCLTGPTHLMVELAEAFTRMVSHADWAMFCKNGTDANTMATMVARNHTGRRTLVIAKGAYHGAAPWSTPFPYGTTAGDRANQVFYEYNNVESLEEAVKAAGDDLAAIFASPIKHDVFVDQERPDPAYARRARELCDEHGALLVVDDVRAGFRLARDCSWALVGVEPDLSCWGKAIANGHPLSALLGNNKARKAASGIYVTGSYWLASAVMAASLVTLKMVAETNYLEETQRLGERLRAGLSDSAARHGFSLRQTGPAEMPLIMFDEDPYVAKGYAFVGNMLERGVYLHPWHNMFMSASMTDADIDFTLEAAEASFKKLALENPQEPPAQILAMQELLHAA
jgi:glutamate-1-semialdehyde 2,1-aminomutase